MSNKRYISGRNYEYKAINELKEQGYNCLRSAGSHSSVDICAFDLNGFRLIQVKSLQSTIGGWSSKWNEIKELSELSVPTNCRKELWVWFKDQHKWKKEVLDKC